MAIWDEHVEVAKALSSLAGEVSKVVDVIYSSLAEGGQLLIAGNGGSAADAQHISAELTGRFLRERRPLRAIALHANTSALTAVGNDFGFEHVFARELTSHARPGDVLLAISTSGNSANILRPLRQLDSVTSKSLASPENRGTDAAAWTFVCVPQVTPRIQVHITIGPRLRAYGGETGGAMKQNS